MQPTRCAVLSGRLMPTLGATLGSSVMSAMDYSKVADLYDLYAQTDVDVPFFLQEAQGCRSVLELTSGTGRLSLPLIQAHVPLTCLDNSPDMLMGLRRKLLDQGLSAPVYQMDASSFSLPQQFDLIIIPFNAFAEFTDPVVQQTTLATIYSHLADSGRLICTLHNPEVRLETVDGQVHLRGKYALPDGQGMFFLSSWESYDTATHLVSGGQFYELYDRDGVMQSKRFVELRFYLHSKDTFDALAKSEGFRVVALYGDYERAAFQPQKSPFMIWVLSKQ
jgi:SAM-dependent methyltransferase